MGILNLYKQSFGIFDSLIVVFFLFNLFLMLNRDRSVFGIPPGHNKQISMVILELFPLLGILGTVWGLSNALLAMSNTTGPGMQVGVVAKQFGGALSTTFLGLLSVALTLVIGALLSNDSHDASETGD